MQEVSFKQDTAVTLLSWSIRVTRFSTEMVNRIGRYFQETEIDRSHIPSMQKYRQRDIYDYNEYNVQIYSNGVFNGKQSRPLILLPMTQKTIQYMEKMQKGAACHVDGIL